MNPIREPLPGSGPLRRWLAPPASWLFGLGSRTYHALYDHRFRPVIHLAAPVISVGNLTVGGTGKTPVVAALIEALCAAGHRPAVLTRGYGGSRRGTLLGAELSPDEAVAFGDEPAELALRFPQVPMIVGPDRASGARRGLARNEADLFVLDDGYQHRRLHRDVNLLLVDGTRPFGSGRLLPWGSLREAPAAAGRATHVLFTGSAASPETRAQLQALAPQAHQLQVNTDVVGVGGLHDRATDALTPGSRVWGVTGIAEPDRVRATVASLGAEVVGWSAFRDHHVFTSAEIAAVQAKAKAAGALLLTTRKDAMRLQCVVQQPELWRVLEIRSSVESGWERLVATLQLKS